MQDHDSNQADPGASRPSVDARQATVRRATRADAAAVRELTRAAYAKWVPVIGREPKPMTADYDAAVRDHWVDLLEVDGELVALIEMASGADHLLIVNVAVAPASQGRGFGRVLLAHAEVVAGSLRLEEMRLYTNGLFAENLRLYGRLGYRVDRKEAHPQLGVAVHMSKRLSTPAVGAARGRPVRSRQHAVTGTVEGPTAAAGATLTVWGRRSAFNVQKVLWLLGELGLVHEHVPAGGGFGGLDTPDFLAMNPHGRVPVLRDGKATVWESHAILRYLAATYGRGRFWADDPLLRSWDDRWMDWAQASLQPDFLMGVFWGFYRTPERLRDMPAIKAKVARCAAHMRALDQALANQPYLGGGDLGLADIPAGTAMFRYFGLQIDRPSVPNVEAWFTRLQERPAYREHVMVPFGELNGKLGY